ncbi:hypothetical protein JOE61_003854 [Nocardioides salarius]|uniref:Uncharacterized protein n=1 Tax=Nocardioides salarius TaxID=374513 RepID=A0ABS2MFS5_9ACTN|nr:hypothetical protein [Nocardioides salarius]MBM7510040.1 hypothetical protein [Nocardioides salarius]
MSQWIKSAEEKYGGGFLTNRPQQSDEARELANVAGPHPGTSASPLSPQSPLFWFGIVAAASVGLMAYSTSVRVGPISASVGVGK